MNLNQIIGKCNPYDSNYHYKSGYSYAPSYLLDGKGKATIREVSTLEILPKYAPAPAIGLKAYSIIESLPKPDLSKAEAGGLESMLLTQSEIKRDRIDLILSSIDIAKKVTDDNLSSLYSDLLLIGSKYLEWSQTSKERNKLAMDFIKEKMRLYDSIRSEKSNFLKTISFMSKDLREALLSSKKQSRGMKGLIDTQEEDDYL